MLWTVHQTSRSLEPPKLAYWPSEMPRRSNRPPGRTARQRQGRQGGPSPPRLLGRGDLDDHVRRLDDADGLIPDLEVELVHGLGRHEAYDPVRARDDLYDGRDPIAFDPRHDAGKPIAGRLRDDRPISGRSSAFLDQPGDLVDVEESLATLGSLHSHLALGLPATKGLDRDVEHLGRLADADSGAWRRKCSVHTDEY